MIDVGIHVSTGRIRDGQQITDDRQLVPRLAAGEVGLGEAELLKLRGRVVVEKAASLRCRDRSARGTGAVAIDIGGAAALHCSSSTSSNGVRELDFGSSSLRAGERVLNIVICIAAVTRCSW